jgi:hypothetical protein
MKKRKPRRVLKTENAKRGRRSRDKGKVFENWVCQKLRKIYPDVRRQLEFQKDVAREGVDLVHTGRLKIQCKKLKGYAAINAIFQVQIDPLEGGCPVLITQADRREAMAVLPLDELIRLLRNSRG